MTNRNYSSTAITTTLTAPINNSQTSLTVAATTGYPAAPFLIAIDPGTVSQEVCLVTGVASTTFTVTRGYDSTSAVAHLAGAVVQHSYAAIDLRDSRTHENASTGVHGAAGAVVGTTDAQALTNKTIGSTNTINGFTASQLLSSDGTGRAVASGKTVPAGTVVGTSDAQTLTTKTIALGSNTVSGTTAQFNTALTDNDFATLAGAETLTNKTLTTPTVTTPTITVSGLTALPPIRCTSGTRPSHNEAQVIYETDTELMYVSDGANWHVILSEITGWTAVTYTNSWVDFGAPYQTLQYKKIGNRVFFRGTAKNGTVGAGTPVFTLPAGFRPPSNLILSMASAGAFGQIEIATTGTVAVTAGNNASVNLNKIDFEIA